MTSNKVIAATFLETARADDDGGGDGVGEDDGGGDGDPGAAAVPDEGAVPVSSVSVGRQPLYPLLSDRQLQAETSYEVADAPMAGSSTGVP